MNKKPGLVAFSIDFDGFSYLYEISLANEANHFFFD